MSVRPFAKANRFWIFDFGFWIEKWLSPLPCLPPLPCPLFVNTPRRLRNTPVRFRTAMPMPPATLPIQVWQLFAGLGFAVSRLARLLFLGLGIVGLLFAVLEIVAFA